MDAPGKAIRVYIRFYGYLADYAGTRRVDLEVAAQTPTAEVLRAVRARYPGAFAPGQDEQGTIKAFRNSELVTAETEGEAVEAGDELRFFPAISGG